MERDLWAISLWYRMFGVATLLIGLRLALLPRSSFGAVLVLVPAVALFATGHGLGRLHRWALIVVGLFSGLQLAGSLLGLALALSGAGERGHSEPGCGRALGAVIGFLVHLAILRAVANRRAYALCTPEVRKSALEWPLKPSFRWRSRYLKIPLILIAVLAGLFLVALVFAAARG